MTDLNLNTINSSLRNCAPNEIIEWALSLGKSPIVTTNFGPFEAVILHLVNEQCPDIPVVCVDHGYNTEATYRFTERLVSQLALNTHFYTPRVTAKRREVTLGGVPSIEDSDAHEKFTHEVKLEPFSRAMDEFKPEVWFTAIRKEQTPFRNSLDIVTIDGRTSVIKVAPLFHWSEADLEDYLRDKNLPNEKDYFDPTKVEDDRECGLHVAAPSNDAIQPPTAA